jgi:hypothetical protein
MLMLPLVFSAFKAAIVEVSDSLVQILESILHFSERGFVIRFGLVSSNYFLVNFCYERTSDVNLPSVLHFIMLYNLQPKIMSESIHLTE